VSGILDWLSAHPLQSAPAVNQEDTVDILREVYAATPNGPVPVAVSIDPLYRHMGYMTLVDESGRACGLIGYELAESLGWFIPPTP